MKKYMAGMMCAALVMGLCACGNSSAGSAVDSVSEAPSAAEDAPADDVKAEIEENILKALEARDAGNYAEAEQYMQIVSEKSLAAYPAYSESEDDPLQQWGMVTYKNYVDFDEPAPQMPDMTLYSVALYQNGTSKETRLDDRGQVILTTKMAYYESGQVQSEESYNARTGILERIKNYDENGNATLITDYDDSGAVTWENRAYYNADNQLQKEEEEYSGYKPNVYEYSYNGNGTLREKVVKISDSDKTTRTVWDYDEHNFWKTETSYDENGNLEKAYSCVNTYDENGNALEHVEYLTDTTHNNALSFKESVVYDGQNRIISDTKQYVENLTSIRQEYSYDEGGNLVDSVQYDEKGDMCAHDVYQYREGRKISNRWEIPRDDESTVDSNTTGEITYYYAPKEILEKLGML